MPVGTPGRNLSSSSLAQVKSTAHSAYVAQTCARARKQRQQQIAELVAEVGHLEATLRSLREEFETTEAALLAVGEANNQLTDSLGIVQVHIQSLDREKADLIRWITTSAQPTLSDSQPGISSSAISILGSAPAFAPLHDISLAETSSSGACSWPYLRSNSADTIYVSPASLPAGVPVSQTISRFRDPGPVAPPGLPWHAQGLSWNPFDTGAVGSPQLASPPTSRFPTPRPQHSLSINPSDVTSSSLLSMGDTASVDAAMAALALARSSSATGTLGEQSTREYRRELSLPSRQSTRSTCGSSDVYSSGSSVRDARLTLPQSVWSTPAQFAAGVSQGWGTLDCSDCENPGWHKQAPP